MAENEFKNLRFNTSQSLSLSENDINNNNGNNNPAKEDYMKNRREFKRRVVELEANF